jgi:hypothetical protein
MTTVKKNLAPVKPHNTGITGGLKVPNNKVPARPILNPVVNPAGWGPATKTAPLKMTKAVIDDGVFSSDVKVHGPKGTKISSNTAEQTIKAKMSDGKFATGKFSGETLSIVDAAGKSKVLASTAGTVAQAVKDYKEVAADMSHDVDRSSDDAEFSAHYAGAGNAGKLISVTENTEQWSSFQMHPNTSTELKTFDSRTGKQVQLSDLLSKGQFDSVVSQLKKALPGIKGARGMDEGLDGATFSLDGRERDVVNNNFALTTNSKGKVQIEVSWGSGIHAMGPAMAHFAFEAPTDAAFRAKIGQE